jgi:hypothetical protein
MLYSAYRIDGRTSPSVYLYLYLDLSLLSSLPGICNSGAKIEGDEAKRGIG